MSRRWCTRVVSGAVSGGESEIKKHTVLGVLAPLAEELWPGEGRLAGGGGGGSVGPGAGGEGVGECGVVVGPLLGCHRVGRGGSESEEYLDSRK